jgi:predicted transcriptional regulator
LREDGSAGIARHRVYEKMREGIVDFEKIRMLREQAASSNDKAVKDIVKKLDEHLKVFKAERDFDQAKITADVVKGRVLLDELTDRLNK